MAKQTQLRQLIDAYTRKVERHAALQLDRVATPDERETAFNDAVLAEKRIFSLFDSLGQQLESMTRAEVTNMAALSAAHDEINRLNTARPIPTPDMPFDEAKARAGEPIQIKYDGQWYDAQYVGRDKRGHVVNMESIPNASNALSYWGEGAIRMTSKTQDIQMFANVFKRPGASGQIGALYMVEDDARRAAGVIDVESLGAHHSVTATPVTITVAK